MNFQANLFFGFSFMMFLDLGKHVLWLCDELESQKEVELWFMIFLELGKHVSWLCDELENQNKFGFGFVRDLELGQHILHKLKKQLFTFCIMVGMPFISMIKIQHTKFENRWWLAWWSPSESSSYYAGNVSIVVELGLFHFWVHSSQCFYRNNLSRFHFYRNHSQMDSFFLSHKFCNDDIFEYINCWCHSVWHDYTWTGSVL